MDDNAHRRRQNEQPMHTNSNPRYPVGPADPSQQRRSFAAGSTERFRPAPINTGASATRGMGGTASYSGYYQEPVAAFSAGMTQGAMQYQSDYNQDTRQTQGFGAYNAAAGMMYNVPQAGNQNTVYDTSQQFQSRQPAALQMMPTEVPAPYFPGEPTSAATAAAATALQGQTSSSSTPSAVYQQGTTDRSALLQNYQTNIGPMTGMSQTGSAGEVMDDPQRQQQQHQQQQHQQQHQQHQQQPQHAQHQQQPPQQTQQGQAQQQQPGGQAQGTFTISNVEEAYSEYQSELREVFQKITVGQLATASDLLMRVSKWLLSKVVELGLTLDNKDLHADRIRLWNDFNHAWLGLFQSQKDMMLSAPANQRPAGLISHEDLEKMGTELIELCDGIERHGLVDYQYGVWEERIIQVLTECVELYEQTDESSAGLSGTNSHNR